MDKQQGPTVYREYSPGNYIQYPVINHNGRGKKKKNFQRKFSVHIKIYCVKYTLGFEDSAPKAEMSH